MSRDIISTKKNNCLYIIYAAKPATFEYHMKGFLEHNQKEHYMQIM